MDLKCSHWKGFTIALPNFPTEEDMYRVSDGFCKYKEIVRALPALKMCAASLHCKVPLALSPRATSMLC